LSFFPPFLSSSSVWVISTPSSVIIIHWRLRYMRLAEGYPYSQFRGFPSVPGLLEKIPGEHLSLSAADDDSDEVRDCGVVGTCPPGGFVSGLRVCVDLRRRGREMSGMRESACCARRFVTSSPLLGRSWLCASEMSRRELEATSSASRLDCLNYDPDVMM
jgi:hypothetical protein